MKIIDRKMSITVPLATLASMFNYDLEPDSFADVYHDGYSASEIINDPPELPEDKYGKTFINLFAREIAQAQEVAERDVIADDMRKNNIAALQRTLLKIDLTGGGAEYVSTDKIDISAKAGILSCEIDEANEVATLEILNPEHLINSIINGVGYFYPDLSATEEASKEEILLRIEYLKDFFEVFGESIEQPSNSTGGLADIETIIDNLGFYLEQVEISDLVDRIGVYSAENMVPYIALAEKHTRHKKAEIIEALVDFFDGQNTTNDAKIETLKKL